METNGVKYIRHVYNKTNGTNRHVEYELIKNTIQKAILPDVVNIETDRENSKGKDIDTWLYVYNVTSWEYGNKVSGLRKTNLKNVFEGNLLDPAFEKRRPQSLVFFEFSANKELLVIDVFKDFYTHHPFAFRLLLETHNFLLRKKAADNSCL